MILGQQRVTRHKDMHRCSNAQAEREVWKQQLREGLEKSDHLSQVKEILRHVIDALYVGE